MTKTDTHRELDDDFAFDKVTKKDFHRDRMRRKEKRINNALRSKNWEDLIDIDEDDY